MALNKLSRSRTEQARLVERAQIVLACLSGKRNDEIAAEMKLRPNTVGVWRNRFATQGMAGLYDQARSGKPATYDHLDLRRRILERLENSPTRWNEHMGRWFACSKLECITGRGLAHFT